MVVDGPECLYLLAREVFPPDCVCQAWHDTGELDGTRWVLSSKFVEFAQRVLGAGVVSHDDELGE